MPGLQTNSSEELSVLATALAIFFSKVVDLEDLDVLGNFVVAVGSIILTIASQEQAVLAQNKDVQLDTQQQLKELQEQIRQLQQLK